jgi:hypothetical protein
MRTLQRSGKSMTGFNLDNYVDVPTRLGMALQKYPDLRIQETQREIIEMPDKSCFIRCTVTVWRDANDPIPAIASACEIYPGRTPYTKMSENEVGFTSALGRALGYMGFGINKSIASRNEVEAAQSRQPTGRLAPVVPMHDVEVPFPDEPQREYASPKQLGMMRALANGQGLKGDDLKTFISATLNREVHTSGELTKRDISKVIDALKASEQN